MWHRAKRSSSYEKTVRWSFVFALSGALFFIVGLSTARETYQEWKVDQEIQGLEAQIAELDGHRLKLSETLQRLQSSDVLDKEARSKLSVQKPGERVIVIREQTTSTNAGWSDTTPLAVSVTPPVSPSTNPSKWFDYFFSH